MRPLSALELLNIWEQGLTQLPLQRGLALLAAACPDTSPDTLAQLSIGQRDARLLTLREWMFGSQLVSLVTCPACQEPLELNFNVSDIRVASDIAAVEPLSWVEAGYEVSFRLPNSLDLAALAKGGEVTDTRSRLLERCLLNAEHEGQPTTVAQLPDPVIEAAVERMAQADPQADIQIGLTCPDCSHQWQAIFDIVSFFWSEINAWAYRTLHQVHRLALAYGWCEADILSMSPWRRQFYLELVGR